MCDQLFTWPTDQPRHATKRLNLPDRNQVAPTSSLLYRLAKIYYKAQKYSNLWMLMNIPEARSTSPLGLPLEGEVSPMPLVIECPCRQEIEGSRRTCRQKVKCPGCGQAVPRAGAGRGRTGRRRGHAGELPIVASTAEQNNPGSSDVRGAGKAKKRRSRPDSKREEGRGTRRQGSR